MFQLVSFDYIAGNVNCESKSSTWQLGIVVISFTPIVNDDQGFSQHLQM